MDILKITLIQTDLFWEDTEKNLRQFTEKIRRIKDETDIIVLPEMFNTGFTMNTGKCAEATDGKTVLWMRKTAAEKNAVITGSLIIKENNSFYNRLIWMKPDGTFEKYDKRHLFRLGKENGYFSRGNESLITEFKGWKLKPLVCYDLRFPVWSKNKLIERRNNTNDLRLTTYDSIYDYDCLIYVANWPLPRINAWRALLISRAIENMSYVIGVNRIGNDGNGISHPGCSMAVDYKGNIIYESKPDIEDIHTIEISYKELDKYRQHFAFSLDWDNFTIINEE